MNHFCEKSALGLAALVFGLSNGFAPAHASAQDQFNGVYLGTSLGGLATTADMESTGELSYSGSSEGMDTFSSTSSQTQKKAFWEAHLGYGSRVQDWPLWLGLEVFAGTTGPALSEDIPAFFEYELSTHSTFSFDNYEFGIDFRPGLLIRPSTLVYARVGAVFTSLELQGSLDLGEIQEDFQGANFNSNDNITGLRLGAGVEQKLGCRFSVSADYLYTSYGDISASGESTFVDDRFSVTLSGMNEAKNIYNHAFMLGLSYYPMIKNCE